MNLKTGKFIFRIVVTLLVFGFGVAIFFAGSDPGMKLVGSNMASMVFGTWMSSGSTTTKAALNSKKTKSHLTEVVVTDDNENNDDDDSKDNVKDFLNQLDERKKD